MKPPSLLLLNAQNDANRSDAERQLGAFISATFMDGHSETIGTNDSLWDASVRMVSEWNDPVSDSADTGTFLGRCRTALLRSVCGDVGIPTSLRTAAQEFRNRDRDRWREDCTHPGHGHAAQSRESGEMAAAHKDINDALQRATRSVSELAIVRAENEYQNAQRFAQRCMSILSSRPADVNVHTNNILCSNSRIKDILNRQTAEHDTANISDSPGCQHESAVVNVDLNVNAEIRIVEERWPDELQQVSEDEYCALRALWTMNKVGREPLPPASRAIGRRIISALRRKQQQEQQLLLAVHGGPGTGKSLLLAVILDVMDQENLGKPLKLGAQGGPAASMGLGSRTIDDAIGFTAQKRQSNGQMPTFEINAQKLERLKLAIGSSPPIVFIEEFSFVSVYLWYRLDTALRQLTGKRMEHFGGLHVVSFGDLLQLPPTAGSSVYDFRWKMHNRRLPLPLNDPERLGLDAFLALEMVELTEQLRATDTVLQEFIRNLRKMDASVDPAWIRTHIQELSAEDVRAEPAWVRAPKVIRSNYLRVHLTPGSVQTLAVQLGVPVIRWKRTGIKEFSILTDEQLEELYTVEPGLWYYFVQGAEALLKANVNVPIGLGNGAKIELESLAFADRSYFVPSGSPGETITLEEPPSAVIARVLGRVDENSMSKSAPRPEGSLVDGFRVLLTPWLFSNTEPLTSSVSKRYGLPTTVTEHKPFEFKLLVAATTYAVQGQTLQRVILDLSEGKGKTKMSMTQLNVMLTRARTTTTMRRLPDVGRDSLEYIRNLRWPPALVAFWNAYSNGRFTESMYKPPMDPQPAQKKKSKRKPLPEPTIRAGAAQVNPPRDLPPPPPRDLSPPPPPPPPPPPLRDLPPQCFVLQMGGLCLGGGAELRRCNGDGKLNEDGTPRGCGRMFHHCCVTRLPCEGCGDYNDHNTACGRRECCPECPK